MYVFQSYRSSLKLSIHLWIPSQWLKFYCLKQFKKHKLELRFELWLSLHIMGEKEIEACLFRAPLSPGALIITFKHLLRRRATGFYQKKQNRLRDI